MNRQALLVAAALTVFSAAAHAGEGDVLTVARPAEASTAPTDPVREPAAAAGETKPETLPKAQQEAKPESKSVPVSAPESAVAHDKTQVKSEPVTAAAPETKPVEKPLNSSAAKLVPVADSYQQAHDSLLAWLRSSSGKMDAVDGKIADLKKLIAEKEAQITQLKLEASKANDSKARTFDQETRTLWAQLKTEEARRKDLREALSSATAQKVRELNRAALDQLDKATAK